MWLRIVPVVASLALLTTSSEAADPCSGPHAAMARMAAISCPSGANTSFKVGASLSSNCQVAATVPVCAAGFANPITTDATGVWHDSTHIFILNAGGNNAITGTIKTRYGDDPISNGKFDTKTRILTFDYSIPRNGEHGKSTLLLAPDDSALSGSWQKSGQTGAWLLTRGKPSAASVQALASAPPYQPPQSSNGNPQSGYTLLPSAAGKCTGQGWTVSPLANTTIQTSDTSYGGAVCQINISTHLPQAGASIGAQASNGVVTQTGPLSLVYQPNPGFSGTDQFAIRYCGTNAGGQSGCSTIDYTMTVVGAASANQLPPGVAANISNRQRRRAAAQIAATAPPPVAPTVTPHCHRDGWQVSPLARTTIQTADQSYGGAACTQTVVTGLPQASIAIVTQGQNGQVTQSGALTYTYQPNPGFRGTDQFVVNYCGANNSGQSGCSAVQHIVTVQ
jgi:hypothetical protein